METETSGATLKIIGAFLLGVLLTFGSLQMTDGSLTKGFLSRGEIGVEQSNRQVSPGNDSQVGLIHDRLLIMESQLSNLSLELDLVKDKVNSIDDQIDVNPEYIGDKTVGEVIDELFFHSYNYLYAPTLKK